MPEFHKSVLLNEVLSALNVKKGFWYLDCTLGDGGYSLEILKLGGFIVGLDVDPEAIDRAKQRFENEGLSGYKIIRGNFKDLKELVPKGQKFGGVIFDLGVSSLQLDKAEKGFSLQKEGPLDMRMDPDLQVRALDLVNGLNEGELYELFTKLGEEKRAKALASTLVSARKIEPIKTTIQLAKLVEKVIGRTGKIHPATKIFQALRIAVNDELNALREALPEALDIVESGVICVISFHSLEDRIVKNYFKSLKGEILTKKPILASADEIKVNPRSRSAKMRVFKKI